MSSDKFIMPLFYKRFMASTQDWTDEEVGAYLRLLVHQWDNGNIPNETHRLNRIANSAEKNWGLLSKKFPTGKNPVMEQIREERLKFIEKQRNNGKKGGRKKTQKEPKPLANLNPEESLTVVSSGSIVDEVIVFSKSLTEVSKLKIQLSEEQSQKLVAEHGIEKVKSILQDMDNYKPLTKKYISVYSTAMSWLKKRTNDTKHRINPQALDLPTGTKPVWKKD